MTRLSCGLLAFGSLTLVAAPVSAQTVSEYDAVRAARPAGRTIPVNGLTLVRDAYRIDLRSGVLHLLAPIDGETFGAVFLGEGEYRLEPATESERRHLRLVTDDDRLETLTDEFEQLLLLFTDQTGEDMLAHAPVVEGDADPRATEVYEDYLEQQRERIQINLHLRIVSDLLNRPGRSDGVFLATVDGDEYGPALLAFDPLGISNLAAQFGFLGGEEVALISFDRRDSGFWYLSARAPEAVEGRGKPGQPLADAEHYEIETTFDGREILGRTTITLTPLVDGIRVLPVNIFRKLTVHSAVLEDDRPIELGVIQEELEQGWVAQWSDEGADADAAIVFPEPLVRGSSVRVRIGYEGRDVLEGRSGSYSVRARESWYPNLGTFSDLATYEMTFRFPRRDQLVAVGTQVREETDGNQTVAVWRSDTPIRVAGFNYGRFERLSRTDEDTGLEFNVYTNPRELGGARVEDTMADAQNASRVATVFFGPAPYTQLSVTQQVEWNFGQSWPSLVFLPTSAVSSAIALSPDASPGLREFTKTVGWHEMAHQWWGHLVGWASYRDQWLSEGFAEFTAGLMLEFTEGPEEYDAFWDRRRSEILDRGRYVANHEAGAMTQGFRLGTRRSAGAARAMIYAKGGYVVHMLRMMMRADGQPNPDEAFQAMMHDFTSSWAGRSPSTDDFQAVAERHMSPAMDLAGDGTLDYFFEQWIRGTDIPTLSSTLEVTDLGDGRYRISGNVSQEDVSEGFRTLVPIYLDFGDNVVKFGAVALSGPTSQALNGQFPLPRSPRRVLVNAMHDVLAR